jgi:hypothetical protein
MAMPCSLPTNATERVRAELQAVRAAIKAS